MSDLNSLRNTDWNEHVHHKNELVHHKGLNSSFLRVPLCRSTSKG